MEQPHNTQSPQPALWPSLEMLGLKTPRPALPLRRPRLVIGSDERAQIRLKSPDIAARHAVISSSSTGWFLRDLDSPSGTFVNDQRIGEVQLNDQDRIRIGPFVFRYLAPSLEPSAPKEPAAPLPLPAALPVSRAPALPADRGPVISSALRPSAQAAAQSAFPTPSAPPHDREAATAEHSSHSATVPQSPLATLPAPPPKTQAAVRLRPVVGRRRRESARTNYIESAPPPAETDDSAQNADLPEDEEDSLEPQTPRGRVAGYLMLMLISMGVAALLAWRFSPPISLIRAEITFQNQAGESLLKNKAFFESQESLLQSQGVREAAIKRLSHPPGKGQAALDAGFLSQAAGVRAVGGLKWESPAQRPAMASLVLTIRSLNPQADAARATALIRAFCDAQAAQAKSNIADLKTQLLQSEVDGLKQEIAFRNHNPDQIRKEIEALKNTAPSELQIELMAKRQAALRAALENAMQERLSAERDAASAQKPATAPTTQSASRSTALPATLPSGSPRSATRAVSAQAPPSASGTDDKAAARNQRIQQARSHELQLQGELDQAIRESVEAQVRSERITEQQQKLSNMLAELPRLQATLKQKTAELAELKKASAGIEVLPPDDARIVGVEDQRGLRVAIAVAGVALLFGLLMIAVTPGGGAEKSGEPGASH
jgi:hypothetical protein